MQSQAATLPSMIGAPVTQAVCAMPVQSSNRRAKRTECSCWSAARTLTAKKPVAWNAGSVRARRSRQNSTRGGSSDTEVKELMVRPIGSPDGDRVVARSEEQTSELQSLMRISYAVLCVKDKKKITITETRKETMLNT